MALIEGRSYFKTSSPAQSSDFAGASAVAKSYSGIRRRDGLRWTEVAKPRNPAMAGLLRLYASIRSRSKSGILDLLWP